MPFSKATLSFLRGLKAHNEKSWFEAHRAAYESFVKAPMLELIEEMDVRLARFAPEIVGDRRRSMFRIYRDIRFSKDKSPYKTHASCWFYHRDGSRAVGREGIGGGAGFYFQISPDGSYSGGGMWMPPKPALDRIREKIAEGHKAFARAAKSFGSLDEDDGAVLKRMPRGYAVDHPAGRWLQFQSFVTGRELTNAQAISSKLPALLEKDYRRMLPLVRWLNNALGMKNAARR